MLDIKDEERKFEFYYEESAACQGLNVINLICVYWAKQ